MSRSTIPRMPIAMIVVLVLLSIGLLWRGYTRTSTPRRARNVILFVGDGMGVSTVTATRIFSVGVGGELAIDRLPHVAFSRTFTADHITPDSAGTMTAMMCGVNANQGIVGFGPETERGDFNKDGDGTPLVSLLEQAVGAEMRVGVVTTTRVTHATPASCYAHANDREDEAAIALQALPGDESFNPRLGAGLDLILGGGRTHFVSAGVLDEEQEPGSRLDHRDLRSEYQAAGYHYVWNAEQFAAVSGSDLPVLGLFESSHMEYEQDRPGDTGGEPSLAEMTRKAIDLLGGATSGTEAGYFLMVEGGRIDHAHHAGNAYRALVDTREFDQAVATALDAVDLEETLIIVTADHSHVFNIGGYPLRPIAELPYRPKSTPLAYEESSSNLLDVVYDLDPNTGDVVVVPDATGVPYTALQYANGPGARLRRRVAPQSDPFPGWGGHTGMTPTDPSYRQEATVPLASETHGAEDVAIYATGPGSYRVRGTVKNTHVYQVMRLALGFPDANASDSDTDSTNK